MSHQHLEVKDSIQILDSLANSADHINSIQFGITGSPTILAETHQWTFVDTTCQDVYMRGFDLIVNRDIRDSLFCDTLRCDSLPQNKYDLYALLLHELGHAHSLGHINDPFSTMWWASSIGASPYTQAYERKIWIDYDAQADSGGNRVMQFALDSSVYACGSLPLIQPIYLTDCGRGMTSSDCHPTGIESIKSESGFGIFPNPACENISINFSQEINKDGRLLIFDMTGEKKVEMNIRGFSGYVSIDIHTLPSGIYIVRFEDSQLHVSKKFVKL